jgi:hypothetical protein
MSNQNEIILYNPNDTVKLEVRLQDETVWLTQDQIAYLFGTKRPAITKHLGNIFKSGELDEQVVCSILELTTPHGAIAGKTQIQQVKFYNLDAILSVGYRVNSINATMFRRWANTVLNHDFIMILLITLIIINPVNHFNPNNQCSDRNGNESRRTLKKYLKQVKK